MYSQEELDILAKQAKEKLSKNNQVTENEEDLYAEFREEPISKLNDEDINIKNSYDHTDYQSYDKIRNTPSDDEIKQNHEILQFDEPLFVGGPTKTQLDSWKKQWEGYDIYVTEIQEQYFVFRTLNRFEYKQVVALQNIDALQREEIICETVTLYPNEYKWDKMAKGKAGIPSTYSQIIMEKSGFTNEYAIEVL